MRVDIAKVLHVLAHELRTPSGIAQGYLRMLLEERLADPADRRRALEQAQKALARVSELTHESTQLANWIEAERSPAASIDAATLIDRAVEGLESGPAADISVAKVPAARIRTLDADALIGALRSLVKATVRELRNTRCHVEARVLNNRRLDVLVGPAEKLPALADGPDAPHNEALALERGGLGLSLVTAAVVLQAHDAFGWTASGSRTTVGIRLPLEEERPLQ